MERYLYSVNPKRPIKNLSVDVPIIRSPKSLRLSKDEVKECLKSAIVHRRFANEARLERVTISSLDRFHNEKYMTEEEYEKFLEAKIDNNNGTVINSALETLNKEAIVEDIIEEEVVDTVESEETVDEDAEQSTEIVATEEEEEVEVENDGDTETESVVDEVVEDKVNTESEKSFNNNKPHYSGKNKHSKH